MSSSNKELRPATAKTPKIIKLATESSSDNYGFRKHRPQTAVTPASTLRKTFSARSRFVEARSEEVAKMFSIVNSIEARRDVMIIDEDIENAHQISHSKFPSKGKSSILELLHTESEGTKGSTLTFLFRNKETRDNLHFPYKT